MVASADTVYVANQGDSTISVFARSTCNARNLSGCPTSTPPSTPTGPLPGLLGYDAPSRTLYIDIQGADVVAALDTRRCNAHRTSGCAARAPGLQTGGGPYWMLVDAKTRTVYTADYIDGVLEVLDPRVCNATRTSGCRHEAASFAGLHDTSALDTVHHTYYQADAGGTLLLTDTRRCRIGHATACAGATARAKLDGEPSSLDVDLGTHTLYVVDNGTHTLSIIDTSLCNASRQDGCRLSPAVSVPGAPLLYPHVNQRTHTVYIGQPDYSGDTSPKIAVVRGTRCNATDRTGCATALTQVALEHNPYTVDVDEATDTVYATSPFDGSDLITLLPGAACDAGGSGCAPVATTAAGPGPFATAIDDSTHTMYVADLASFGPGARVSVINTRHCNAGDISRCSTTWPSFPAAPTVFGIQVTSPGRTLMTANLGDSTVTVVDLQHCTGTDQSGCPGQPRKIAVGYSPQVAWPSPETDTVYVFNAADATTSLIDLRHPCRTQRCFR